MDKHHNLFLVPTLATFYQVHLASAIRNKVMQCSTGSPWIVVFMMMQFDRNCSNNDGDEALVPITLMQPDDRFKALTL